jgi:hypothetical protein
MKKLLVVAFLFAVAGLSTAGAQTFRAGVGDTRQGEQTRRAPAAPYQRAPWEHCRGRRVAIPLQMLNPRAPQKYYGPPEDTVTWNYPNRDPYTRHEITGLILFGLRW